MSWSGRWSLGLLVGIVPLAGAHAQVDSTVTAFLATARTATARYHDCATAMGAGYRPVGPDTPGMGQHWINTRLLIAGRLDPAAPQILEYVTIENHCVLVGVAFALPLSGDEAPPSMPVPASLWHAHSGTAEDESLTGSHAGMGAMVGDRVAVLHAWVWTANPAGVFEAQNWALPFVRVGLTIPPNTSPAAAQALALGTGSAPFYLAQFLALLKPDSADRVSVERVVRQYSDSVARWRARGAPLDSVTVAWLAGEWTDLHAALAATLSPRGAARLAALRER